MSKRSDTKPLYHPMSRRRRRRRRRRLHRSNRYCSFTDCLRIVIIGVIH